MYRDSRGTMTLFHRAGLPIPGELRATAELVLGRRFEEALARLPAEVDERAYREAVAIADEARAFECKLPIDGARRQLEAALSKQLRRVVTGDTDVEHTGAATPLGAALALCDVADRLALALDLERPQELLYEALRDGLQRTPAVLDLADRLRLSRKIPS